LTIVAIGPAKTAATVLITSTGSNVFASRRSRGLPASRRWILVPPDPVPTVPFAVPT
jgi:hypothetical protein